MARDPLFPQSSLKHMYTIKTNFVCGGYNEDTVSFDDFIADFLLYLFNISRIFQKFSIKDEFFCYEQRRV